jgi:type II secretory pathway pseudopilin PulG
MGGRRLDAMSGQRLSPRGGFSWVEMLAIVTILAIIAAIIVPRVVRSSEAAKMKLNHHNKAVINTAVDRWYVEKGAWPASDLADISADPQYFPEGLPANPLSTAPYTLNPANHRVE